MASLSTLEQLREVDVNNPQQITDEPVIITDTTAYLQLGYVRRAFRVVGNSDIIVKDNNGVILTKGIDYFLGQLAEDQRYTANYGFPIYSSILISKAVGNYTVTYLWVGTYCSANFFSYLFTQIKTLLLETIPGLNTAITVLQNGLSALSNTVLTHMADMISHVSSTDRARWDGKAKITVVANVAAMNALTGMNAGDECKVIADVGGERTSYLWDGIAWQLDADANWQNLNLAWSALTGIPSVIGNLISGLFKSTNLPDMPQNLAGQDGKVPTVSGGVYVLQTPSGGGGSDAATLGGSTLASIAGHISDLATNTWTAKSIPVAAYWVGLCYGNGIYCALNQSGVLSTAVMTSPDGINWTSNAIPLTGNIWAMCFGNGLFVAVNNTGTLASSVMTSPDGITWTTRTIPVSMPLGFVGYGNGLFVAFTINAGVNAVLTSPDGITWTSRTIPSANALMSMCYGKGLYIIVAQSLVPNTSILTSPDGINWTFRTAPSGTTWHTICYGNGLFVALAYTNVVQEIMISSDGINWIIQNSPIARGWISICYGNGLFVALSQTGLAATQLMVSVDGINWYWKPIPVAMNYGVVSYGAGLFLALANNGTAAQQLIISSKMIPMV